ncbi:hypothetical protein [Sulfitobacter sp. EhC04]|uniref:hypothetical protein n=1 Tax=Sulfitobacter sp. EhC04 TaxID=1849168 RepID=UPI0009ED1C22|nr:hypothetical protein [Sulfitobacter sp. EhC04]|tara:strand:+ start:29368 stop:29751 length:384 start_codon:yes stop_codon:yes gene_type:complete
MKHLVASVTLFTLPFASLANADSSNFSTMAVEEDTPLACEAPRPPTSLDPSPYIRNGYRAILRIMAAERWIETGSCECYFTQIPWDEVVLEADGYVTSDNPLLPFKVAELRLQADEMLATRDAACPN